MTSVDREEVFQTKTRVSSMIDGLENKIKMLQAEKQKYQSDISEIHKYYLDKISSLERRGCQECTDRQVITDFRLEHQRCITRNLFASILRLEDQFSAELVVSPLDTCKDVDAPTEPENIEDQPVVASKSKISWSAWRNFLLIENRTSWNKGQKRVAIAITKSLVYNPGSTIPYSSVIKAVLSHVEKEFDTDRKSLYPLMRAVMRYPISGQEQYVSDYSLK
jgi:hypothetical protein